MALVDEDELCVKVNTHWRSLSKLYLPKQLIPLLGYAATSVLAHLQWELNEGNRIRIQKDGKKALCQSIAEMANFLACSPHTLRGKNGVLQRLVDLKLVFKRNPSHGLNRSTLWRLNYARLDTLLKVADAFGQSLSTEAWQTWKTENSSLFEKFATLPWHNIEKGHSFGEAHQMVFGDAHQMAFGDTHQMNNKENKEEIKNSETIVSEQPSADNNIIKFSSMGRNSDKFGTMNQKEKPDAKPCRFVEYWNSLPYVPKTKLGTKAYEIARRFFAAHRRYEAGECRGFMLTNDVREKIDLTSINKKPADQDFRTDKEMKLHIRKAACAYDPQYAPIKKDWLGKSLVDFLYRDGKFNKGGTISHFLERVSSHPRRIERESFQKIVNNAEEWELEVAEIVTDLYFAANRRNKKADPVNLYELKAALSIVRKLVEAYEKIPTHRISIFANHFPDYTYFLNWWKRYCEDRVWQGMPITALAPGRNLWRSFVDFVSDDIGWHIFTGERVH